MYDITSSRAEDFINAKEISDSLEYASLNKCNITLIEAILKKARTYGGLLHREALVLLDCEIPKYNQEIYNLAKEIKDFFYGNRIVMFAPLYLSNYCINGCVYCPYHRRNLHIRRKKLSQDEIREEVVALQNIGHKRLAIELGEHPIENPIEYVLESIKTIYNVKYKKGAIRRVNVNIAATSVENYVRLKHAGIGTYILFQETYNKEAYEMLHPSGPKHNYSYHTEAIDRAMDGGIDDVGCGVLFGLNMYRYDFVGLLMHIEHLVATKGCGPHTVSVPRIRNADGICADSFSNAISDNIFEKIVAVLRIAVPYTGIIVSTRESPESRKRVLKVGVSQLSGGSRTSVGGYVKEENTSSQFEVSDQRTLDQIVDWLIEMGYIPSFCTACYREGRTGDRFMSLIKSGMIKDNCHNNALLTLKEYLIDYASLLTKVHGEKLIEIELEKISNVVIRQEVKRRLAKIENGRRDFRF